MIFKYYYKHLFVSKYLYYYLALFGINLILVIIFRFAYEPYTIFFDFIIPNYIATIFITFFHKKLTSNIIYKNISKQYKNIFKWNIIIFNHYILILLPFLTSTIINYEWIFNLSRYFYLGSSYIHTAYFLLFSGLFLWPIGYLFTSMCIILLVKNKHWFLTLIIFWFIFNILFNSLLIPLYISRGNVLFPISYPFRIINYFNPSFSAMGMYYLGQLNFEHGAKATNMYALLSSKEMYNIGTYSNFEVIGIIIGGYITIPALYSLLFLPKINTII